MPWTPEQSFADRLVLIRRHLRLTQPEAARRANINAKTWANWEAGTQPYNLADAVHRITGAFDVDRDWLMWGDDPDTAPPPADDPRARSRWEQREATHA